jgi:hypothetical protein
MTLAQSKARHLSRVPALHVQVEIPDGSGRACDLSGLCHGVNPRAPVTDALALARQNHAQLRSCKGKDNAVWSTLTL